MPQQDPDSSERQRQRAEAIAANASLSFPTGEDAEVAYKKWRSQDPFPDIAPALLNSADIVNYAAVTGMLDPFDPRGLKPASYEMKLRGPYVYIDEKGRKHEGQLEKDSDEVIVARNGITFLTVETFFRLPDYIALRHNLKIDHIYKGLLVGTGPLIDPGFVGRIALPLHNLTENDYTFRAGDGIIWAEFTKLSSLPATTPPASKDAIHVTRDGQYVSFPAEKTRARTVGDYIKSAVGTDPVPASSTARTNRRAKKALNRAKRTQTVFAGVTLGVALTVAGTVTALVVPRINDVRDDNREQRQEIIDLENQIDELRQQVQQSQVQPDSPVASPTNPDGN